MFSLQVRNVDTRRSNSDRITSGINGIQYRWMLGLTGGILKRKARASHLYSNTDGRLADGTKQKLYHCHIRYRVGPSASSAGLSTGQKLTNDL
jgi:hypothetical protein